MDSVFFAPSILASDFGRLNQEVQSVQSMADFIHVDVMDGHFVPNITIGPVVSNALKGSSEIQVPFSIHLMISEPEKYASDFEVGSEDLIIFHIETTDRPNETIRVLQELGCRVGISQKPDGEISQIFPLLEIIDEVLVMGVQPGFGGQEFIPETLEEIRQLSNEIDRRGEDTLIAVDGGMNDSTVGDVVKAGADVIIAGSAVFGKGDRLQALKNLQEAASVDEQT